jgi:GDP-4-dehydro-6-deoxy-D-mannose reductase
VNTAKALVTGATGFVGPHLIAHLRAAGDEVVPLGLDGRRVDVTDAEAVEAAMASHAPEVVYHLAALSHIGDSWDAPSRVFRVNAEGTLNVLRAAAAAGVQRVLVVGSADEYGTVDRSSLPIAEDVPLRPRTPYGASKVAAEYLALQAHLGDRLDTVRVRAFNHTGPGQGSSYLVPALAHRVVEAEHDVPTAIAVGSLEAVRDFTDVRDVVRAYRLLAHQGEAGDVYNVCSGRGLSVRAVADRLLALTGIDARLEVDPELVRPIEVPALVGDCTKATAATGWVPEIDLEQTLTDILDEARAATATAH